MSVEEAYAEVGRITRREAKNFAYGIMVLPRDKRRAIAAIYAFARAVDDIADGDLPADEKRASRKATKTGSTGSSSSAARSFSSRARFSSGGSSPSATSSTLRAKA